MPRYAVTVIYRNQQRKKQKKRFCPTKKKEQSQKKKKNNDDFRKVIISDYMPPNTKDLAINQTMVAYRNRQKRNSVRASKQLRFVAITETFNGNQALALTMYPPHSFIS